MGDEKVTLGRAYHTLTICSECRSETRACQCEEPTLPHGWDEAHRIIYTTCEKCRQNPDFAFSVTYCPPSNEYKGSYSVCLPHQCDSWEIAGVELSESVGQVCCDRETAIRRMELFIKQAQVAIEKLKSGKPLPEFDDDNE